MGKIKTFLKQLRTDDEIILILSKNSIKVEGCICSAKYLIDLLTRFYNILFQWILKTHKIITKLLSSKMLSYITWNYNYSIEWIGDKNGSPVFSCFNREKNCRTPLDAGVSAVEFRWVRGFDFWGEKQRQIANRNECSIRLLFVNACYIGLCNAEFIRANDIYMHRKWIEIGVIHQKRWFFEVSLAILRLQEVVCHFY